MTSNNGGTPLNNTVLYFKVVTFGWYFRTLIQSELVTEGSALMMAIDINIIFYEYNYLYRMTQKIQQKKYEIMRWFWDIVFLQLQQLAQVCNEKVLVGTDILKSPLNC